MSKIYILNGAQPYDFAPGRLNETLAGRSKATLEAQGHEVRLTTVATGYDVQAEVDSHLWADVVFLQFPVNWMGVPWSFKKIHGRGLHGRHGRSAQQWRRPQR